MPIAEDKEKITIRTMSLLVFFIMGFTDYSPAPGYGQLVVIAQLVSGVLLLAALFPIHISRISTFKNR